MTTSISPGQYCKNPELYKNDPTLSNTTRKYWDEYCKAMDEIARLKAPESKDAGEMSKGVFEQFAMGLLTPEGLKLLVLNMGGEIAIRKLGTTIANAFANTLTQAEIKAAEKILARQGTKAAVNMSIAGSRIFKAIKYADILIAKEAGYYAGRAASLRIMQFMKLAGGFLQAVDAVMLLLTIVSIIFDTWDPCKINSRISNSQLATLSTRFNEVFRDTCLGHFSVGMDAYGKKLYSSDWPIPFYLEDSALVTYKKDHYEELRIILTARYLDSLTFNSDGDPIFKYTGGHVVTNQELKGVHLSLLKIFGTENTVVQNWFYKWWPIPVGILFLLIIIFIVIKGKKDA